MIPQIMRLEVCYCFLASHSYDFCLMEHKTKLKKQNISDTFFVVAWASKELTCNTLATTQNMLKNTVVEKHSNCIAGP